MDLGQGVALVLSRKGGAYANAVIQKNVWKEKFTKVWVGLKASDQE